MTALKQSIAEYYERSEAALNGLRNTGWHHTRRDAFTHFSSVDFPTQRDEEWKYVNLSAVVKNSYAASVESTLQRNDIPAFIDTTELNVLVFVNGRFKSEWSSLIDTNVQALSLHAAYGEHAVVIDQHVGRYLSAENNAFVAANAACLEDGVFISVAANQTVEHELLILNVMDAREQATMVQPRHLLVLDHHASVKVIMRTQTIGSQPSLCNQVCECVVGNSAQLHCVLVQDDVTNATMINTMHMEQDAASRTEIVSTTLSGSLVRNTVSTRLAESAAEAHMLGVYCVGGSTVVDNHTVMDHATPHCHSNELFKGIVDGSAHAVFNGKIFVRQDAQKTLAYQSNRNVVLSDTASVNTKPQLEIFADDVKCSHGCTVGKLDDEALFYLRARGIGEAQARALLLCAFAEEVTASIGLESLRSWIDAKIEAQLLQRSAENAAQHMDHKGVASR